jgi:hypothetical protein
VMASWTVFRLKHCGHQCWGVRKIGGNPRLREFGTNAQELWRGDKESLKACTRLRSWEPLYTCPHAPFYRETKGLLHSENTLASKEYF